MKKEINDPHICAFVCLPKSTLELEPLAGGETRAGRDAA